MKIIFFGNTKYSLIGAKIIHAKLPLTAIVTIEHSPVAKFAKEENIPLITTKQLGNDIIEQIKQFGADFFIVEDYGLFLPQKLLELPEIAPLNVHHSLLPKYRGPSPAPAAILAGEKVSGVSIIKMTNEIDAGDILAQEKYELEADETTQSLLTKLNELGGDLVVKVLQNFFQITPTSQTIPTTPYTPHMTKNDGYIDITNLPDKEKLDRMIRAYYPWPGVWTKMNINSKERIVKFLPPVISNEVRDPEEAGKNEQHEISHPQEVRNNTILVQVEGKKPMSVKDFMNGYPDNRQIIEKLF